MTLSIYRKQQSFALEACNARVAFRALIHMIVS